MRLSFIVTDSSQASTALRIVLEVIITARLFLARSTPLGGLSAIRKSENDVYADVLSYFRDAKLGRRRHIYE